MTDFVVYEDTPLAEYLSSFDGADSAIKLPPLQTHSDEKKGSFLSRMSPSNEASYSLSRILLHYWQRSLLHDTFTVCLPLAEESAFEERFKYLIVTSPLLSEVLSVHNANRKKQKHAAPHMTTDYSTPTFKVSKAKRVSTAATVSGLLAALGAESALIHQQQANGLLKFVSAPFTSITTLMTGSLSIFLLYRHMRRNGIRQLYQTTLSRLQSLMESCETLDNKVHRAIITIQEIELVSRGYRLSIPLSPISRIEQSSKTRRCTKLRNRLAATLRRAFIVFEEGIIDLTDQVNKQNLSRLYDMYNVKSIASLSAVDRMESNGDSNIGCSLDCLRTLAQLMHAKRRECMMQLLALNIVTEEHDSKRHDYQNGWKAVNTVLLKLTEETKKFTDDVSAALENELCKPATDMEMISRSLSPNSTSVTDNRLKLFLHKLASLDQQLRTLEAKVYLCNQDIRQVASGESDNISPDDLREQLRKEYMSIQHDLSQMATDWEAGRAALLNFLEPPELDLSPSSSSSTPESPQKESPSPLPSPSMEGTKIFNSEETSILDLPLPARPSVFEAVVEMAETSRPERSCKSRAERIAEMKAKREQEAREKSNRMDTQNMVHELKDVLGRRVTEFDLEPTDKTEDK